MCLVYLILLHFTVSTGDCLQCRRPELNPWVRKISWSMKWQPTPVFLLGKFHGQGSLVGSSPWGHKGSDTTKYVHTHKMFLNDCNNIWIQTRVKFFSLLTWQSLLDYWSAIVKFLNFLIQFLKVMLCLVCF